VLDGNERADRFYRSHGWEPDGDRLDEEVWGLLVSVVGYRRELAWDSVNSFGPDALGPADAMPTRCP
jgi:hypothetical protein